MKDNPVKALAALGQSIWLDYIRRNLIVSGELRQLIEEDGLRGMTSKPAIFEKAIGESHDYDEDIRAMALEGRSVIAIYEALSLADVQSAADAFQAVYDKTGGRDGYVSLEVNPHLAHDTMGTIEEARRLAAITIAIAYLWPRTAFPHAGHVLLSTWASLFHMTMALGEDITLFTLAVIPAFLFLAVWIPCCTSDIVFPLLFSNDAP